jgi:hypothetical protein
MRSSNQSSTTYHWRNSLIHEELSLWQRTQPPPLPGSRVIEVPFSFQLPDSLPPSFRASRSYGSGTVIYFLEVVAYRPGRLQSNRHIRADLTVLPAGIPEHIQIRSRLVNGWGASMPWRTHAYKQSIRRGVWGDYSSVEVKVGHDVSQAFLSAHHALSFACPIFQLYPSAHQYRFS